MSLHAKSPSRRTCSLSLVIQRSDVLHCTAFDAFLQAAPVPQRIITNAWILIRALYHRPRRLVSVSILQLTVAPMTHNLGVLRGVQAEVGVWHRGSRGRLWNLQERGVTAKGHYERTCQARTSGQTLTEGT
jgi:hypothetical protein